MEGIGECTGAGTGCGGCHDTILDIVDAVAGEAAHLVTSVPAPTPAPASPGPRRLPVIVPDLSEVA